MVFIHYKNIYVPVPSRDFGVALSRFLYRKFGSVSFNSRFTLFNVIKDKHDQWYIQLPTDFNSKERLHYDSVCFFELSLFLKEMNVSQIEINNLQFNLIRYLSDQEINLWIIIQNYLPSVADLAVYEINR